MDAAGSFTDLEFFAVSGAMGELSTSLVVWIVVVVLVVAAGYFFWRRWWNERLLHVACPGCGRRLAYKAKSGGGHGMCPQCGEKLTFPS